MVIGDERSTALSYNIMVIYSCTCARKQARLAMGKGRGYIQQARKRRVSEVSPVEEEIRNAREERRTVRRYKRWEGTVREKEREDSQRRGRGARWPGDRDGRGAQDAQTHTVKWLDGWWTRRGSTKAARIVLCAVKRPSF